MATAGAKGEEHGHRSNRYNPVPWTSTIPSTALGFLCHEEYSISTSNRRSQTLGNSKCPKLKSDFNFTGEGEYKLGKGLCQQRRRADLIAFCSSFLSITLVASVLR